MNALLFSLIVISSASAATVFGYEKAGEYDQPCFGLSNADGDWVIFRTLRNPSVVNPRYPETPRHPNGPTLTFLSKEKFLVKNLKHEATDKPCVPKNAKSIKTVYFGDTEKDYGIEEVYSPGTLKDSLGIPFRVALTTWKMIVKVNSLNLICPDPPQRRII